MASASRLLDLDAVASSLDECFATLDSGSHNIVSLVVIHGGHTHRVSPYCFSHESTQRFFKCRCLSFTRSLVKLLPKDVSVNIALNSM